MGFLSPPPLLYGVVRQIKFTSNNNYGIGNKLVIDKKSVVVNRCIILG